MPKNKKTADFSSSGSDTHKKPKKYKSLCFGFFFVLFVRLISFFESSSKKKKNSFLPLPSSPSSFSCFFFLKKKKRKNEVKKKIMIWVFWEKKFSFKQTLHDGWKTTILQTQGFYFFLFGVVCEKNVMEKKLVRDNGVESFILLTSNKRILIQKKSLCCWRQQKANHFFRTNFIIQFFTLRAHVTDYLVLN